VIPTFSTIVALPKKLGGAIVGCLNVSTMLDSQISVQQEQQVPLHLPQPRVFLLKHISTVFVGQHLF
jgi:hypothetical protein